jgi:hypothetical protein
MKLLLVMVLLSGFMIDPFSTESADAFAEKMDAYFNTPTNYVMRDVGTWWSATVAVGNPLKCTSTVFLDDQWYNSTSPLWKYTLVHEWVHVSQGKYCVNNEKATELKTIKILKEAKEWGALIAGVNHFVANGRITMDEAINAIKE